MYVVNNNHCNVIIVTMGPSHVCLYCAAVAMNIWHDSVATSHVAS